MLSKNEKARLIELLDTYCGWDIQERKPGRWVAVDRYDHHVVVDTWADSLEDCERKTLHAASRCAGVIIENLVQKCRLSI